MDPIAAVRRTVDLLNTDRAAWFQTIHPAIDVIFDPRWPDAGPALAGRDAIVQYVNRFDEAWSSLEFLIDEIDSEDDQVLSRCRWLAEGAESRAATELVFSAVWSVETDGLIRTVHFFLDHDEALAFAHSPGR